MSHDRLKPHRYEAQPCMSFTSKMISLYCHSVAIYKGHWTILFSIKVIKVDSELKIDTNISNRMPSCKTLKDF